MDVALSQKSVQRHQPCTTANSQTLGVYHGKQVLKEAAAGSVRQGRAEALAVAKNALVDAATVVSQPNPLKESVAQGSGYAGRGRGRGRGSKALKDGGTALVAPTYTREAAAEGRKNAKALAKAQATAAHLFLPGHSGYA